MIRPSNRTQGTIMQSLLSKTPARLALLGAVFMGCSAAMAQSVSPTDEWNYVVTPRDTLIGLVNRLMKPPATWQKLQELNRLPNPQSLKPGSVVRLPVAWLKSTAAVATVAVAQGVVSVRRGTARLASTAVGTEVLPGDVVETGAQSTLTLRFVDGSSVVVAPQSKVMIENLLVYGKSGITETRLRIEEGGLDSSVKPKTLVSSSRYVVTTPVFNLGVRGTEFRARFDPNSKVAFSEVLSGGVAAQGAKSQVPIGAGFGTLALINTDPKPPIKLLDAPLLRGIGKTASRVPVDLSWEAEKDASGYRAQVFTDRSFSRQVVEGVFTQPVAHWLTLPDGAYVLRVRSIDADGLEGASTASDFVLKARPEAPFASAPADAARLVGNNALLKWSEPPEALSYRLQVSSQADFSQLQFDRKDITATQLNLALPPGTYFWRVATLIAGNDQGPFGDVQRFELVAP
jgi:hypothetical protein